MEYIGAYSFFSVKRNNVATMAGPIVTLAVDLDKFEYYDLIVIDRNGNFKAPTFKLMRKWLKDVPSLLKQFDAETIQDETRKTKDYLYDLSEALNHK